MLDLLQRFETVATRHGQVQHHDIPALAADQRQQLMCIARFTESGLGKRFGQNLLDTLAHNSMIVGQ